VNTMSGSQGSIPIIGAGAQTPVGRSFLASAAAVRCGISAYGEHPYMIDKHGQPMVVACADWLDVGMPWQDRLITLALDAATEALAPIAAGLSMSKKPLALYLAIPDATPRRQALDHLPEQLARQLGLGRTPRVFKGGHAAGMAALAAAQTAIWSGQEEFCLVGGVDSQLDPELLESLDSAGRLHSVNNSWGMIPGEASAFLLLASPMLPPAKLLPLAHLASVAIAEEAKTMGTKTVCIGEGLTAALRAALEPVAPDLIAHSWCDMNGETYRADEYGFSVCRLRERFDDASAFTSPADCWGDVGAASAPLLATLPIAGWNRTYIRGGTHLVWTSSSSLPLRGAAVLRRANPRGSAA